MNGSPLWLFHRIGEICAICGLLCFCIAADCGKHGKPETPDKPSGAFLGRTGELYRYSARNNNSDDTMSFQFDWGDSTSSAWTAYVHPGDVASDSHVFNRARSYGVSVRSRLPGITEPSDWSDTLLVRIAWAEGALKWSVALPAPGLSPAMSLDTLLLVPAGALYSFRSDGAERWTEHFGPVSTALSLASNQTAYCVSADSLVCLTLPNSVKWRFPAFARPGTGPALGSDGTVYVNDDVSLLAVNANGSLKWRYPVGDSVRSSPVIDASGTIYVGADDGYLYAVNPDGAGKWRYPTAGPITGNAAIAADGAVYVGSTDGYLYAFEPGGSLRWRYPTGDRITGGPVFARDYTLYVGSWDGFLHAVNPDGSQFWRYPAGGPIASTPAVGMDGVIYLGVENGQGFQAVNLDGTPRWRYAALDTAWSSPVISPDSTVYVSSGAGRVYAFQGFGRPVDSPWGMFQHDPRHTGRAGGQLP